MSDCHRSRDRGAEATFPDRIRPHDDDIGNKIPTDNIGARRM
jgi:hypothetical protein